MTREELNEMTDWNDDDEAVELWDAATAELNDDEDDEFDIFTTTTYLADAKQEEKKVNIAARKTITEDIKAALNHKPIIRDSTKN